ncbi:hypothetical protein E4U60_000917 [Claviceps pazoutovae]|uniref:Uncharacterized protein n=1 Tax=Claviceps pazoutovae TaxID=1649127 RepID=A0A9P7MDU1_9HYPO|nr:hypothetical protein E4U60_000917 [Claviceps pazoutovae]
MLRTIPWAVLALAPVTNAQFGRLSPRDDSRECCPCPPSGQPGNGGGVVTVTQPAKTVYVSIANETPNKQHTVTVERTVAAGTHTVYVTRSQSLDGPSYTPADASQSVITVSRRPQSTSDLEPQTVTVTEGDAQGSAQPLQVTSTTHHDSRKGHSEPKTVTVQVDSPQVKLFSAITVTQDQPSLQTPWSSPSVVTVTQTGHQQQQTPSEVTVTASPEPPAVNYSPVAQPHGTNNVIATMQSSPSLAQPASVTAPLQVQTVFQTIDHYSTYTKTIEGGSGGEGGDNIEIIIINIYTGETFCKKKYSGEPCHVRSDDLPFSSSTSVLSDVASSSANVTTRVEKVFKTATVTLHSGIFTGAARPTDVKLVTNVASAYGTGILTFSSGNFSGVAQPTGRKPRGPMSIRKW